MMALWPSLAVGEGAPKVSDGLEPGERSKTLMIDVIAIPHASQVPTLPCQPVQAALDLPQGDQIGQQEATTCFGSCLMTPSEDVNAPSSSQKVTLASGSATCSAICRHVWPSCCAGTMSADHCRHRSFEGRVFLTALASSTLWAHSVGGGRYRKPSCMHKAHFRCRCRLSLAVIGCPSLYLGLGALC